MTETATKALVEAARRASKAGIDRGTAKRVVDEAYDQINQETAAKVYGRTEEQGR